MMPLLVGGAGFVCISHAKADESPRPETVVLLSDDCESGEVGQAINTSSIAWQGNDGSPVQAQVVDADPPGPPHELNAHIVQVNDRVLSLVARRTRFNLKQLDPAAAIVFASQFRRAALGIVHGVSECFVIDVDPNLPSLPDFPFGLNRIEPGPGVFRSPSLLHAPSRV